MIRKGDIIKMISACVFFLCAGYFANAAPRLRISLITCGPGTEFIGASFGHTAIRITDSASGADDAYNYGTFDFNEASFELRFAKGNLAYSISKSTFREFAEEYLQTGRSVNEQVLSLSPKEAAKLQTALAENLLPENRHYIYSSVYDNCATRVRDIVRNIVDSPFRYGAATPGDARLSFRQVFNSRLTGEPWERLGINILSGRPVDKIMSNDEAMYLPDYLANGFRGATVGSHKLVKTEQQLLPQLAPLPRDTHFGAPFFTVLIVSLLILICNFYSPLQKARPYLNSSLLAITGLLGVLMLVMWFGTDHKICRYNLNLLWCLPTNLLYPVFRKRGKGRYAIIALILLGLCPLLQLFHVQIFPVAEIWPLWLALATVFGMIYRQDKSVISPV